jgi:hypothetical protein
MTVQRLPTWQEMNRDTTPEAEKVLLRLWLETPAWRKLELLEQLNRSARQLAVVGLRRRHPEATPDELRRLLADMVLGPELATRVYGPPRYE